MESSLELQAKAAFFKQLDAVWKNEWSHDHNHNHDNDHKPDKEQSNLRTRRLRQSRLPSKPAENASPKDNVRGVRETVIRGTPLHKTAAMINARRRTGTATAATTGSFVEETPVVSGARTRPLTAHESPSASTAPFGRRKRKRPSGSTIQPEVVAEELQIFKGMSFFYIPNDDIAPARRRRIAIAQKFGAQWVRSPEQATHIVVDGNLAYRDIETIVAPAMVPTAGEREPPVIVKEHFQGDSVELGFAVNPMQFKYRVRGCPPQVDLLGFGKSKDLQTTPDRVTVHQNHDEPPRPGDPGESLQFQAKPQPRPSATVDDDDDDDGMSAKTSAGPPKTTTQTQITPKVVTGSEAQDELTSCMQLIAQVKHLPLDDADDDGVNDDDDYDGDSQGSADRDGGSGEEEEHNSNTKRPKWTGVPQPRAKDISWQDRFSCNHGGTVDSRLQSKVDSDNPNARTIEILQRMCDHYYRTNDHWRTTAYRRAIKTLERQTSRITTEAEAGRLPGIGPRLASKIEEIAATDRLRRLEYALSEPLDGVLQLFLGIYGVGPSQARRWIARGFRTLQDLTRPEAQLSKNQRMGLEHYADLNTRIPRREVEAIASLIRHEAAKIDDRVELVVGGSYRRGAETSGDVDLMVTRKGTVSTDELVPFLERLIGRLTEMGVIVATVAALHSGRAGSSKWHGCCVLPRGGEGTEQPRPVWRRVDFLLVPETEYGAALIYFTGNDLFNRSMRLLASKKGMRLNQRGLYDGAMRGPGRVKVTEGRLIEGRSEKWIFEVLGVKWREPSERWC